MMNCATSWQTVRPLMFGLLRIALLTAVACFLTPTVTAEPETHVAPSGNPTFPEMPASIPLWAQGAPGSEGLASPEQTRWEHYDTTWYPVLTNINFPSITPFLPPIGQGTGVAVIVCPGGGHQYLALEHEGFSVGKWLAEHGIAAFVLKYRLARAPGSSYRVDVHALMDAQRAIRLVRSRAKEWSLDPSQIGILGFSAGGEVAFLAATQFEHPVKGTSESVDSLNCRPDFQGLFYPGLPHPQPPIGLRTPPAFLCGASDDQIHLTVPMVQMYLSLEAAGVPCELHVYARGGHGFGIRDQDKTVYSWMGLFTAWIADLRKAKLL
jgi:acetyl esterase/lipase